MLTVIKDSIYIIGAVIGLVSSFVGGVWWLSSVWSAIKENKKLREEDKKELIEEINELKSKIDRVERETQHRVEQTHKLFADIKEQLARMEGRLEIFFREK